MMQATSAAMRLRAWDLESGSSSGWDVLPAPAHNVGFREKGSFALSLPHSEGMTLLVDDEPLARAHGSPTEWTWKPGFYAGEVTAQLVDVEGRTVEGYLLDVSPDPAKSGREAFREMLDEVWVEDPLLVAGSEPATHRMGALDDTQDPWIELARLRQHAPAFLRALRLVHARPRQALVRQRESAPLHRVRRVDRRTALAAARNPALVEFLAEGSSSVLGAGTTLDVPRVVETYDCAANRCLMALLRGVAHRTGSLLSRLQSLVEAEVVSDTKTPLAVRWPARRAFLENLASDLKRLGALSPFRETRRPEVTASGLNAVSADPLYAAAWTSGWKALRTGLSGISEADRMWISPSWEVYERWCFVRLAKELRKVRPELGWVRGGSRDAPSWVGTRGDESLELILQPKFPSEHPTANGTSWSVSGQRIPDLVVRSRRRGAEAFMVLDAKYRCARPWVLDAMTSAHVYQDSLRVGDRRPEASLLLIPAGGGAPWLEDPAFHRQHRVGVVPFPPAGPTLLPESLLDWIAV